ncbi:MAG TPA: MerR family transcriptional regulator, partial [Roseiflexaceae bacterium]|nr:MerR family transcriptional regulator [Roseiflexaceae bacterium]
MNGYRPRDVAAQLGISTEALRRCSVEFADLLSPGASAKGMQLGDSQEWRYTSQDIALLSAIRDLLNQGNTIPQVRTQLAGLREAPKNGATPSQALVATQEVGRALVEVVQSQRATIAALEGQIELLRTEAARLQVELERQAGAERDQAELDRQADRYQAEIERLRADIERQRAEIAQQQ